MPASVIESPLPLRAAMLLFGLAGALLLLSRRRGGLRAPGVALLGLGLAASLAAVVARALLEGHAPFLGRYATLSFLAAATAAAGGVLELRRGDGRIGALGALVAALVLGLVDASPLTPELQPLAQPVLRSAYFHVHVACVLASYACLTLGFAAAASALALPSWRDLLGREARAANVAGFALLTLGMVLGSLWAKQAWGTFWPGSRQDMAALAVWATFAAHAHAIMRRPRPGTLDVALGLAGYAATMLSLFHGSVVAS